MVVFNHGQRVRRRGFVMLYARNQPPQRMHGLDWLALWTDEVISTIRSDRNFQHCSPLPPAPCLKSAQTTYSGAAMGSPTRRNPHRLAE